MPNKYSPNQGGKRLLYIIMLFILYENHFLKSLCPSKEGANQTCIVLKIARSHNEDKNTSLALSPLL